MIQKLTFINILERHSTLACTILLFYLLVYNALPSAFTFKIKWSITHLLVRKCFFYIYGQCFSKAFTPTIYLHFDFQMDQKIKVERQLHVILRHFIDSSKHIMQHKYIQQKKLNIVDKNGDNSFTLTTSWKGSHS